MAMIYHQVVIEASKETIYEAISTEAVSKWWIADCTVEPELGFMNLFRVEGHGTNEMKVIDLQPGRRVEWECCNDNDPWSRTRISFEITEKQNACTLTFRHDKWKEMDDFFATCSYHWARHLSMLATWCETGRSELDKSAERHEVEKVISE